MNTLRIPLFESGKDGDRGDLYSPAGSMSTSAGGTSVRSAEDVCTPATDLQPSATAPGAAYRAEAEVSARNQMFEAWDAAIGGCDDEAKPPMARLSTEASALGLPQRNDMTQVFVRNTFLDTPLERPWSLDEFLTERLISSCPATRQPTDDDVHVLLDDVRKAAGQASGGLLGSLKTIATKDSCKALFAALTEFQSRMGSSEASGSTSEAQDFSPQQVLGSQPSGVEQVQTILLSTFLDDATTVPSNCSHAGTGDHLHEGSVGAAAGWQSGTGDDWSPMQWSLMPPPPPMDWAPTAFDFSFEGQRLPPVPQAPADEARVPHALPRITRL